MFPEDRTEAKEESRSAALKALELDDTLAGAHAALGDVYQFFDWDWAGAEREYKRAIELSPSSAAAHERLCLYLTIAGRMDEAVAAAERALELDPVSLPRMARKCARKYGRS